MRIFYVGNFREAFCTEVHIANTLTRLGHEVTCCQEDPDSPVHPEGHDLFLFTRTWSNLVTLPMLQWLRDLGIPSASYHLDLYVGLQREDGLASDPFWRTDYVFQPDGDPHSMQVFADYGINAFWMKPGVDKAECYIADTEIVRQVAFVGSRGYHPEWPYRGQLIDFLAHHYGTAFEHWGSDGMGTIRNAPLNELYASTKVVVGDSLCLSGHTNYWSDRPYETLGRGGFLIMPRIPGLEDEFIHRQDLVYYDYGDWQGLGETIEYYLHHDDERELIRQTGHDRVRTTMTYDERLTQMLEIIGGG
jgi:Glycosyl transferases group 1